LFVYEFHVYIRDQMFDPCQFIAFGRPCKVICDEGIKDTMHPRQESESMEGETDTVHVRCSKGHHWLHKKTIADVVESLVGGFIVDSGFKAATAFLKWVGIKVEFDAFEDTRACSASKGYMSLGETVDTDVLESLLGYKVLHKGLLLQAFVHPSYNKHSGGCYQNQRVRKLCPDICFKEGLPSTGANMSKGFIAFSCGFLLSYWRNKSTRHLQVFL
ncbi:hypothetical protein MKX01_038787, partial [Papaver californicum]